MKVMLTEVSKELRLEKYDRKRVEGERDGLLKKKFE